MVKVKVENIVASAKIAKKLDLSSIGEKVIGASYNPKQFEGVLYKLLDPKVAFLLLRNGKAVCTGAKNPDVIDSAYIKLTQMLEKEGIETYSVESIFIETKSMVASVDLAQEIDLELVVNVLEDDAEYDMDSFPGVIYHIKEPRSTALIFNEGKVVITGPKSMEDLKSTVENVLENLETAGAVVV